MSTTTYLIPNHYPEDFCCLSVHLGATDTAIFQNDREVNMVVDSISILPGAVATVNNSTVRFRIDSASGAEVAAHDVPSSASDGSETYKVARILKPGETLFYQGDADVTALTVQLRIRSRVA